MRKLFPHRQFQSLVLPTLILSVSAAQLCSLVPAMAVESTAIPKAGSGKVPSSTSENSVAHGDSYEQDMTQAYRAFDEQDYPLAKQRYEVILKKDPDDTRAIIGLARTLHRVKTVSGVEPPELREVMEKVKKTLDKFGKNNDEFRKAVEDTLNESVEMQVRKEALAKKLRTGGAVSLRRGGFASTQDDLLMRRSARQRIAENYSKREDTRVQQWNGEALLFRRECPEPMYRDWFFLDPPS